MKTYRAYRVDKTGKIKAGEWLQATDDAVARRQAESLCAPETPKVELWEGGRFICELSCGDDRRAKKPPPPRNL